MKRWEVLASLAVITLFAVANGFYVQPALRAWGVPGWLAALGGMVACWLVGWDLGRAWARMVRKRMEGKR